MHFVGELVALSTSILWAFGTILFGYAGRRVGAFTINTIRICLAVILLGLSCLLLQGSFLPAVYSTKQLWILAVSGVIGLSIGDGCYFKCLVILGPRISSLLSASAPIFAVIIAWIFLDQTLKLLDLLGILITLAGIAWVVFERNHNSFGSQPGPKTLGYFLGICGAVSQAVALTMAKAGMGDNIPALNATLIRMVGAAVAILIVAVFLRRLGGIHKAVADTKSMAAISTAAITGPFLGVWLSLISIQYTKIGIASTLMATTPLWIIPLVMSIHRERPSIRAVFGTAAAVGGVAIIFLF